jgi:aspartyl-tRNA(Asn)/glutamyl-tRNA(Gln) amidotransferase subunit B
MTEKEAAMFVESAELFDYFKKVTSIAGDGNTGTVDKKIARLVINYLSSDYIGLLKKEFGEEKYIEQIALVSPEHFAKLIMLVSGGKINSRGTKDILAILLKNATEKTGKKNADPETIATENGFIQKTDEKELKKMIAEIVAGNPAVVADYKKGKTVALQFLIGQGMKVSRGSANPEILKRIFMENIG